LREDIIQYSKTFALQVQTSWNQAHAPLLVESFPKTPKTGSHNYKTKQAAHCEMALPKSYMTMTNILFQRPTP
jgi:hypothetical protein